jgi:hypothetical protein
MRVTLTLAAALLALGTAGPAQAKPGGCLKYGVGGAVAGKLAGGHTWKGAAAGCALGYLRRRQYNREAAERRRLDDGRAAERRRDDRPRSVERRRGLDPDETGGLGPAF